LEKKKLPEKGFLGRKFMAVALTGIVALGALGVAAPAQAQGFDDMLPGTTRTVVTQLPGQVLNEVLRNTTNGSSRGAGDVMKDAGKRVVRHAKLNQAIQKSVWKILGR
jgi:hypothetical protein